MSPTTTLPGRSAPRRGVPVWLPTGLAAVAVVVLGLIEVRATPYVGSISSQAPLLVVAATAAAVALARVAPGAALALVWMTGAGQVLFDTQLLLVQTAVGVVAYGCARWGSRATVVLSGLSIPASVVAVVGVVLMSTSVGYFRGIAVSISLIDSVSYYRDRTLVGGLGAGLLVLAGPWLAGLAVRASSRARRSEASQAQAEAQTAVAQDAAHQAGEIARLRDDQARLARDVHDVVGHSLAVILAQAESAQYLPDDPTALKSTLATIATSARGSLTDVREVLARTAGGGPPAPAAPPGTAAGLVEGVRATGQDVVLEEIGTPRPLPPELEVVAHRVLQEMLTNAVKHGVRDRPILVERHWPAGGMERDLRIEVRNGVPAEAASDPGETVPLVLAGGDAAVTPGQGVDGMRRRLDSVGGRIDVRRRHDEFTTTAWVPISGR